MKPRHYYILLALAGGDAHGQQIAREADRLSEGSLKLWPATLYGALQELEELGWIEELSHARRPLDASEKTRIYRITRPGGRALQAEADRLTGLARLARSRMRPRARESE